MSDGHHIDIMSGIPFPYVCLPQFGFLFFALFAYTHTPSNWSSNFCHTAQNELSTPNKPISHLLLVRWLIGHTHVPNKPDFRCGTIALYKFQLIIITISHSSPTVQKGQSFWYLSSLSSVFIFILSSCIYFLCWSLSLPLSLSISLFFFYYSCPAWTNRKNSVYTP